MINEQLTEKIIEATKKSVEVHKCGCVLWCFSISMRIDKWPKGFFHSSIRR